MLRSLAQLSALTLLTTGLACFSTSRAASTPAGTRIVNQAVATFDPTETGVSEARSNVVTTTVQTVCAVSVTPLSGMEASALGGDRVVFRLSVLNAGNARSTVPLLVQASGTFNPSATLYHDRNDNGVLDGGEEAVTQLDLDAEARASLLLVVETPFSAQGEASLNLVTSCGGAATATVRVAPPPELQIDKTFSAAKVRPGEETTVTVTTRNPASYEAREVVLTDLLTEQIARGLEFVPGSASASGGTLEYTSDGVTWGPAPSGAVQGVRMRAARLEPGAQLVLSFRMVGRETAEGQQFTNTATVEVPGRSSSDSATVDVRYTPGVAIGPVGNPLAPEGTPADRQSQPFAVVGRQVCFDHTVQNTGDVADLFRITVTFPQGAATVSLLGENGPLAQPLRLDAGQSALVRVCYEPTATGVLEALITVTGERGTSNTTSDQIDRIEATLPELKKSVAAATRDEDGKPVAVGEGKAVATGDTVTYTLEVRNPYNLPLSGVVVTDAVPAHLDFESASDGGVVSGEVDAQQVTWQLGTLQPGERRTLTFVTRVSSRAVDGETLKNLFQMVSTELKQPTNSNEVATPVWSARLLIEKLVSAPEVTYGDRVTYTLRIRNTSPTTAVTDAVITDTPAAGLEYIGGTSTLGGEAIADPARQDGSLIWRVPAIPARGEIVITYEVRVTPQAGESLINTVVVAGKGGETTQAVASNRAAAVTKLNPLKFAAISDIVGVVFVDRNRNGLYDKGFDTPVERARILLAGGRQALTDTQGRYKFANVPFGTQALRLDPNTTPYAPLHLPQDGGLSGTRTAHVRGLTVLDFPLAPLSGDISELRRTTLTQGALRVEKVVYAERAADAGSKPGSYVVELRLTTPQALDGFELRDPLPAGARLKEGGNTLNATLPAGETRLSYRFEWTGESRAATTDPVVRWRY